MQRETVLMGITGLAVGTGLGAGLMYLLDPDRGNRRRALVRDQLVHARKQTGGTLRSTANDLRNRSKGLVAEVRGKLEPQDDVPDQTIEARVRERLGRTVANPGAIVVSARQHRVTLSGPVLREELDELLSTVSNVPGVREVRNLLQVHDRAGDVSGLQAEAPS